MTPTLTRAPEGVKCRFCPNAATVRALGGGLYGSVDLCDPCRRALAAPLPRKEFHGYALRVFRSDGRGGVETRTTGEWVPCFQGVDAIYIGMHKAVNARAWADALEDGAR